MSFIVFEQDPLVRKDICETLEAEFADHAIVMAETIEDLKDAELSVTTPTVAVLSLPGELVQSSVSQIDGMLSAVHYVIIGDDLPDDRIDTRLVHLLRPFTSGSLASAVRAAFRALSDSRGDG